MKKFDIIGSINIYGDKIKANLDCMSDSDEFLYTTFSGKIVPPVVTKSSPSVVIVFINLGGDKHDIHFHFIDESEDTQKIMKQVNLTKIVEDMIEKLLDQDRLKA